MIPAPVKFLPIVFLGLHCVRIHLLDMECRNYSPSHGCIVPDHHSSYTEEQLKICITYLLTDQTRALHGKWLLGSKEDLCCSKLNQELVIIYSNGTTDLVISIKLWWNIVEISAL